nr:uncharacterized protein LOC113829248 [Penaeus vannamei]
MRLSRISGDEATDLWKSLSCHETQGYQHPTADGVLPDQETANPQYKRTYHYGLIIIRTRRSPGWSSVTDELDHHESFGEGSGVLAVGVSAQVGPSGIVSPDGVNTQFSHDFANDVVLVGPAGIVTKSGANRQLTHGEATLHVATAPAPLPVAQLVSQRGVVGHSGIVRPDGNNVQFTHEQANNIVLVGPSGIVTKDGSNIQLTDDLHFVQKRDTYGHLVGASGIVTSDGQLIQFEPGVTVAAAGTYDGQVIQLEPGVTIVQVAPSGIILSNGKNIQLTGKLHSVHKRDTYGHLVGASGIVTSDGQLIQFEPGVTVAAAGPSGVVLSNGKNLHFVQKRDTYGHLVGASGIVTSDGQLIQFEPGVTVAAAGPSGVVLSNGKNIQLSGRRKRDLSGHLVGDSGIITNDGQLIQLEPGVTIVQVAPSGIILSNGKNIQLTGKLHSVHKRDTYGHLVGASGIVTSDGQLIQFEPGVTVAAAGPSGVVLSNGKNIQLTR